MFTEPVQSRAEARDASRGKVLAVAEELFLQRGFGSTTIRQIAEKAAVSVGTVMAVADKDGLLVAIVDRRIAGIQSPTSDVPDPTVSDPTVSDPTISDPAVSDPTVSDPAVEIAALLAGFVRFFAAQPDLGRAYTSVLVGGRHSSTVFVELAGGLVQRVAGILTRSGRSAADASAIARIVHRAYLGELLIWAGSGASDPTRTLAELETTVRYLVHGKAL